MSDKHTIRIDPSAEPRPLTNLQVEEESQRIRSVMRSISTPDLRRARAWLLDLVQASPPPTDFHLIRLRGELVHAEIESREARAGAGMLGRLGVAWSIPGKSGSRAWQKLVSLPNNRNPP